MAEAKEVKGTEVLVKRTRRVSDGKRSITFVYINNTGEVILGKHRTAAFSRDEAWKEFVSKHTLTAGEKMSGSILGHVDYMENKIRKPTRNELLKLAGLTE